MVKKAKRVVMAATHGQRFDNGGGAVQAQPERPAGMADFLRAINHGPFMKSPAAEKGRAIAHGLQEPEKPADKLQSLGLESGHRDANSTVPVFGSEEGREIHWLRSHRGSLLGRDASAAIAQADRNNSRTKNHPPGAGRPRTSARGEARPRARCAARGAGAAPATRFPRERYSRSRACSKNSKIDRPRKMRTA